MAWRRGASEALPGLAAKRLLRNGGWNGAGGSRETMSSIDNRSGTEQLEVGLLSLHLQLSASQRDSLNWLANALLDWNQRANLTGITELDAIWSRHILDSLSVLPLLDDLAPNGAKVLDVGSGAGFPGFPIA